MTVPAAPPLAPPRPAPPLPLPVEEVPDALGVVVAEVLLVVVGVDVLILLVVGVLVVVGADVLVVVGVDVLVVMGLLVPVVEVGTLGVVDVGALVIVALGEAVGVADELEVVGVVVEIVRQSRLASVASMLAPCLRFARKVAFTDGGRLATASSKFAIALFAASQLRASTADETASS